MTNEWAEFKAYTEKPQYISMSKNDKTYMGRFSIDMIKDFTGFSRIFTILARGYLFHDKDGNILSGDPYERISYAKNALLAWCSINDRRSNPEAKVDYRELAPEFPELVNNKGNGWYITHIRSIFRFAYGHYDLLSKPVQEILPDISEVIRRNGKNASDTLQFRYSTEKQEARGAFALTTQSPARLKRDLCVRKSMFFPMS